MATYERMIVDIEVEPNFAAYSAIPCRFEVRQRVDLVALIASGGETVHSFEVDPWLKDYDSDIAERPSSLPSRFEVSEWIVLTAKLDDQLIGGAILGVRSKDFEFPGLHDDAIVLVDIRVSPARRELGIGKLLIEKAVEVSVGLGKKEILVETQDINAPACRLYSKTGFRIELCDPIGYGSDVDEAKIVWSLFP